MSDEETPVLKAVLVFPRPSVVKKAKFESVRDADYSTLLLDEPILINLNQDFDVEATVLWPGIDKAWPVEVDFIVYHVRHEHDVKLVKEFIDHYHYVVHKHVMRTHGSTEFSLAIQLDTSVEESSLSDRVEGTEASIKTAFDRIFTALDVNKSGAIEGDDLSAAALKFGVAFSADDQEATLKAFGDEQQLQLSALTNAWRYNTLPSPFIDLFAKIVKSKRTLRGFSNSFKAMLDRSLPTLPEGWIVRDIEARVGPQDFKAGISLDILGGYNRNDIVEDLYSLFDMLPHEKETFITLKFPLKTTNIARVEKFFTQLNRFFCLLPASISYDSTRRELAKTFMAVRPDFKVHEGHFYLNFGIDINAILGTLSAREVRTTQSFIRALRLFQGPQTVVDASVKLSTDLNAHLDNPEVSLIPTSIFLTLKSRISKILANFIRIFQGKVQTDRSRSSKQSSLPNVIGDFQGKFSFDNLESISSIKLDKMHKILEKAVMGLSIHNFVKIIGYELRRSLFKKSAVVRVRSIQMFVLDLISNFNVDDFSVFGTCWGFSAKIDLKAPGLGRIFSLSTDEIIQLGRDYGSEERYHDDETPDFIKNSKVPSRY